MKGGTNVAMTELLSAAWMVIREFPHDRRRAKIASNIVRDAEYYAFVRERRLVRVEERQVEDRVLAWLFDANRPGMNEMTLDEVLQVAVDRGVERRHIELLSKLGSGQHGEEIAVEWGVSARTVRNYRRLAIDAVREVLVQC
jgi:DNA-binding NarL/FixJ family response regulator